MSQTSPKPGPSVPWQDQVYESLKASGVTQIAYVPDAGHKRLIERAIADPDVQAVSLTSEEEGVGLLAGAHLGGAKGVLLMQSSGVGNCVNQFSLLKLGQFPFVCLVSMRGDFGEANPWQLPMGQAVEPVLRAMDFVIYRVDRPEEAAEAVNAALNIAYSGHAAVGVLLTQRLIGAKVFA